MFVNIKFLCEMKSLFLKWKVSLWNENKFSCHPSMFAVTLTRTYLSMISIWGDICSHEYLVSLLRWAVQVGESCKQIREDAMQAAPTSEGLDWENEWSVKKTDKSSNTNSWVIVTENIIPGIIRWNYAPDRRWIVGGCRTNVAVSNYHMDYFVSFIINIPYCLQCLGRTSMSFMHGSICGCSAQALKLTLSWTTDPNDSQTNPMMDHISE